MQQTLHIFKKDVRYLRYEAGFLVALTFMFALLPTRDFLGLDLMVTLELLIAATAAYTIARVIHAEAIPGTTQFWTTRPYRWISLLGAKLLFILTFVNVPILLAQMIVLKTEGFPIVSNWPGLLCCQVWMIFGVELPLAALAAMTRGLLTFVSSTLVLALIVVGIQSLLAQYRLPDSFSWLRYSIAFVAAVAIASPVLYLQYRNRQTRLNRMWSMGAATVALAAFGLTPWTALFAAQSRLSKTRVDLQVAPYPGGRIDLYSQGQELCLVLPVRVSPLPAGLRAQFENFVVTLERADGQTARLSEGQLFTDYHNGESLGIRGHAPADPSFLQSERDQPVRLHAAFYVTVFGNSHGLALVAPDLPTKISDGLQCYTNGVEDLVFRSAFRLPAKSIEVTLPRELLAQPRWTNTPYSHSVSYSPFPASLRINPIEVSEPYFLIPGSPVVTITIETPLAHLRRDFEIPNLQIEKR